MRPPNDAITDSLGAGYAPVEGLVGPGGTSEDWRDPRRRSPPRGSPGPPAELLATLA